MVRDYGQGVHEEHLEKIFELFTVQMNQENWQNRTGISYCKKIPELHGRKVWAGKDNGLILSLELSLS